MDSNRSKVDPHQPPESITDIFSVPPPAKSESLPEIEPVVLSRSEPAGKPLDREPGEFTKLFQSVTPGIAPVVPKERATEPADLSRVFTQLTRSHSPAQPSQAAPPPGEFTQIIQSFAPAASHSFTNLFQDIIKPEREESSSGLKQASGRTAPDGLEPEDGNPVLSREASTRMFETPAVPQGSLTPSERVAFMRGGQEQAAEYPLAGGSQSKPGTFTELFQSLSNEPVAKDRLPLSSEPAASPMEMGSGGFTQLINALGEVRQPDVIPELAPPPEAVPTPQGPSAFTRIISLPVTAAQGTQQASPIPAALQAPVAKLPTPPAKPKLPDVAAAAKSAPHEWLPIVLIVNAFLLLLVVILVVVLLRRH